MKEPSSPQSLLASDELDFSLMARISKGDMAAMEQLIEIHQGRVLGTVYKMLGPHGDAEDITQQIFLRVWNSAGSYKETAKFTTWLFTITRNLVFNELRRRNRHPVSPLEQEEHENHFQARDAQTPGPDASLLESELQEAIQAAIEALPETQRMAVVLRRFEELSYEEIGDVLGLSVSAVKSILFRARAALRESLSKYLAS
jgi:RNA polymerase sigma-70 factor (ECF subfamily)